MAHVQNITEYDGRTLRALDLMTLGAVSKEEYDTAAEAGNLPADLVWGAPGSTLQLPDALADFLVEKLPEEFRIVEEEALPQPVISLRDLAGQDGVPVPGVEVETLTPAAALQGVAVQDPEALELLKQQAAIDEQVDDDPDSSQAPEDGEDEPVDDDD